MTSGVNGGNGADDHGDQNQPPQNAGSGIPQEQPQPSTSGLQESDGDDIPQDQTQQQQPSTSLLEPSASGGERGEAGSDDEEAVLVPTLPELAVRGLWMSWHLLWGIAHYFTHQPLSPRVLDAVLHSIRAAELIVRWADRLAEKPQSLAWYLKVPAMVLLMVAKTGAELAETYLDIKLPKNQTVVEWLRNIAKNVQQTSGELEVVPAYPQVIDIVEPSTSDDLKIPEVSVASLAWTIIFSIPEDIPQEKVVWDRNAREVEQLQQEKGAEEGVETTDNKREKGEKAQEGKESVRPETSEEKKVEKKSDVVEKAEEETVKDEKEGNKQIPTEKAPQGEEPTLPDTPADADGAKQPKEKEDEGTKEGVEKRGDKSEEAEEKAQKEKAGELPAIATGGAVKSEEHPETPAAAAAAAAAADRCSADEAERAAMSGKAQPSAQTASSRALLAAEGSSRAVPGPRKSAEKQRATAKAKAKAPKRKLLGLFRA